MTEDERHVLETKLHAVIERLKGSASRSGLVSQRAFALEAHRLGLTTDEQQRGLRSGLAALNLYVRAPRRGQSDRRTASASEATVGPTKAVSRLSQARRMLARYADADGTVSKLAHDGVTRLHGLTPAEAQELSTTFPITRPRPPRTPVRVETSGRVRHEAPAAAAKARSAIVKPALANERGVATVSMADVSLAGAVAAARAVMEEDRWRRDLGRVTLKAEQEVGLFVLLRGKAGNLSLDLSEEEIVALPRDGEQWRAYECLVRHNQRLVWKIALGYQGHGLDVEDLAQHGTMGLMRAIRKFDVTNGYKLSTYATHWIKQAITRGIANEGTTIRIPVHMHEKVKKVANAERKFLDEGRSRSIDNVAYATGLTFAEVEKVRSISRLTDSLDRIIGDDTALGDLITGPSRVPGPAVVLIRKEFFDEVDDVLNCFSERDYHILVRRAGLDGDEPATLEALGVVFGVTRERIRQIENKVKPVFRDRLIQRGVVPPRR